MPLPLAYDDLPPGSDIRRERDGDVLTITVPAGDPPREALMQAARDAMAFGATTSIPLLILALIGFYAVVAVRGISGAQLWWGWAFFGVFCAALALLIAATRYFVERDALAVARRQTTIIVATPARLMVETTGPFGAKSLDLRIDTIRGARAHRGLWNDDRGREHRLRHVRIELTEGQSIDLLPGREPAELAVIVQAVKAGIGQ